MAQLPTYEASVDLQAPRQGVYIPPANTEIFEQLYQFAAKRLDEEMEAKGRAQGIADQTANGDGSMVTPGMLGGFTTWGRAYKAGASEQFSVQRQVMLEEEVSRLKKQHAADPDGFRKSFESFRKNWMQTVPMEVSPVFARFADQTMLAGTRELRAEAEQKEKQTKYAEFIDTADVIRTRIHDAIIQGRPQSEIDHMYSQFTSLVEAGGTQGYLSPLQGRKAMDDVRTTSQQATLVKAFRASPNKEAFIKAVQNGDPRVLGSQDHPMSLEDRDRVVARLNTELNQIERQAREYEAKARAEVVRLYDDEIAARTTTGETAGLSESVIRRAYASEPEKANDLINKMKAATQFYSSKQKIAFQTPDQDAAYLDSIKPKPGSGYADSYKYFAATAEAVRDKYTAIAKDPVAYVLSVSPEAKKLLSSANPEDQQQGQAMVEELQKKIGLTENAIKPLTKASAENLVDQITSESDPAKITATMSALAEKYGPRWKDVYKQMVEEKLPGSYQVIAIMDQPGDVNSRRDLALALQAGEKVLKKNIDDMASGTSTQIDREVAAKLSDFRRTEMAAGYGAENVDKVGDAIRTLSYYYTMRGQNPNDAVNAASKAVLDRYSYGDTFRTPRGLLPRAEIVTSYVAASIQPDMLRPLPDRQNERLTPEQKAEQQARAARRGKWVVNDDESGLVLMYPDSTGFVNRPVMDSKGRKFELSWKQITDYNVPPEFVPTDVMVAP